MKYAICNELYEGWTHDKAFEHAALHGYRGIEVAPFTLGDSPTRVDTKEIARIRQAAEKSGLEIVGLHWLLAKTEGYHLTTNDAAVRQATSDYLADLARLCRDLGGDVMVLGSPQQRNLAPGQTENEGMANATEVLRSLAPTLEKCEVTLALEPLGPQEGNFLMTANRAVELAEQVNSRRIQLHLDVKAMTSEDTPVEQIIRKYAPWLAHFHANDPNLRGPGMGEVDFVPIFQALRDIAYEGWVSVEVFDYAPGIDSLVVDSIQYMRDIERSLPENIEIKAHLTPAKLLKVRQQARQLADRGPLELVQCDTFFKSRVGRLKLREFGDGTGELIFYQRSDKEGPKSSKYELVPCPEPEKLKAALAASNGVRGVVKKKRTVYFVGPTRIHLDEVEGLGHFLELEVVMSATQSVEPASEKKTTGIASGDSGVEIAEELMRQLNITQQELVAKAYIDLLLGKPAG